MWSKKGGGNPRRRDDRTPHDENEVNEKDNVHSIKY